MKKLTLLMVFAFMAAGTVVALALTSEVDAQSDSLIEAGVGVGPVRVRMYREDVARALGKPSKTSFPSEGSSGFGPTDYYEYGKKYRYLAVSYSTPPYQVTFIVVKNAERYATAKGIRTGNGNSVLGSSILDVPRAYGEPDYKDCSGTHYCWMTYRSLGIVFTYDPQNNEVYEISVSKPS